MTVQAPIVRSPLERSLARCAAVSRETLAVYLDPTAARESEFGQTLLAAVAAMETAAAHEYSAPRQREAALKVASALCRTAAQECRRHGLDKQLLQTAEACERAGRLCEQALR
jgi:hypothetical protein